MFGRFPAGASAGGTAGCADAAACISGSRPKLVANSCREVMGVSSSGSGAGEVRCHGSRYAETRAPRAPFGTGLGVPRPVAL